MSYQVLARKWRPRNFSEVAGQEHVLKTLIHALDQQRLHHAYLFTGTRGTGKTTLARILARCFNCEQGISSRPCNACSACSEIGEGRFLDLHEIDAASRTKVEDTRELLENVQFAPARARFKVYLIDEVHMLSTHSFNALLKTLEEPPEHVKFLFATTDPQKLPVTILSRCLQFHLKNLRPKAIVKYLGAVLEQEQVECEADALWQLAAAAAGSMRDALTLTDQAIAYCEGKISNSAVIEMLGIPPRQQVFALLRAMAAADLPKVLEISEKLAGQVADYAQTLDNLLTTLHRLAIAQVLPDAVETHLGDRAEIIELARAFSAEDVQLYYQIGNKGREELALSADAREAFEMLLLRMLAFAPEPVTPAAVPPVGGKTKTPDAAASQAPATALSGSDVEAAPEPASAPVAEAKHEARQEAEQEARQVRQEVRHEAGPEARQETRHEAKREAAPEASDEAEHDAGELAGEARSSLIAEYENDPNVQAMLKHFSGKLIRESVTPMAQR